LGWVLPCKLVEDLLLEQAAWNTDLHTNVINIDVNSKWFWLIFVPVLYNSLTGSLIEK
jgi:hypothetical protein